MKRTDMGAYGDWFQLACRQGNLFPRAVPGTTTQRRVRELLDLHDTEVDSCVPALGGSWQDGELLGEVVSWSVGFGPRTEAYVLRPEGRGPFPGIIALHDHANVKYYGKEKIADGPDGPVAELDELRNKFYGGRSYANHLARRGFVVLVHDAFMWGSRRFSIDSQSEASRNQLLAFAATNGRQVQEMSNAEKYDALARQLEHSIAKYCSLLNTSISARICQEDWIALNYLKSRPDVDADRIGCVGLSGGGARTVLLRAVTGDIKAAVITGMMSSFRAFLERHMAAHSWMLFPPGLSRIGDWPDIAACRAPAPILVQYLKGDQLLPSSGMTAAHQRLAEHYAASGRPDRYVSSFVDGSHRFDVVMQEKAFDFLARWLAPGAL
ncbi:dienelactone hydrolase family protein [Streptomyces sp. NBC_00280]|uniref:dienelactone hydrolase family protein n=1 Tax=Streptomyces sp. NBC_00280 TaxID=2975699 RepID=UPI003253EE69